MIANDHPGSIGKLLANLLLKVQEQSDEIGQADMNLTTRHVGSGGRHRQEYLAENEGISIQGYLAQMGDVVVDKVDLAEACNNPFNCPDVDKLAEMEALITQLRRDGDSVGAKITVIANNMPVGLDEPVFSELDSDIAWYRYKGSTSTRVFICTVVREIKHNIKWKV